MSSASFVDDVISAERSSEERLEGIADKVQDEVLEWLHGPTWPKCPSHRHPPRATLIDDVAMWQCPADESVCWRIGGPA